MEYKWFVYLVECYDGTLYCGITNNLEKRIDTHNSGKGAKYTKTRLPVKLYYFEEQNDRSSASKREWQIKKLTRLQKLKLKN
jgi:putative endonuclease